MHGLKTLNDGELEEVIGTTHGVTVVAFTAAWCPPCRLLAPVLAALAAEYEPIIDVRALDVDANPNAVSRFGVRGLPTLLFFRDGAVIDRVVGAVPKAALDVKFNRWADG